MTRFNALPNEPSDQAGASRTEESPELDPGQDERDRNEPVDLGKVRTLREAADVFFAQPGPRRLLKVAGLTWGARFFMGPPSILELPIVGGVVAYWPFQEWFAHKYILHAKPKAIFGKRLDTLAASAHRKHHREPTDLEHTLLPLQVINFAIPTHAAFFFLATGLSPKRTTTAVATMATMALLYEWTHYLVHTGYAPKGTFFKRIRRNHRLHHFYNEDNWLSFVWPDVDKWMKTEPDYKDVVRSTTARKLHDLDD